MERYNTTKVPVEKRAELAIGRALVLEPELLILDRSTEEILPSIVREIGETLNKLNKELGVALLLIEQQLNFLCTVTDNLTILDREHSVANGSLDALAGNLIREYLTV